MCSESSLRLVGSCVMAMKVSVTSGKLAHAFQAVFLPIPNIADVGMQSLVGYGADVTLLSTTRRGDFKTSSSVFHLHNTSATRESVNCQFIWMASAFRHECHTTYLGVTLDRTLSYREHLTKTAGKLRNRNNLLMKLAGSTYGASDNTLRTSALALC